jgi:hypothetical protein
MEWKFTEGQSTSLAVVSVSRQQKEQELQRVRSQGKVTMKGEERRQSMPM